MDAQVLGSKEICMIERCLFVLSLIPIAINLCVKASLKKPIVSILQPILDFYQIKTEKCAIYLVKKNTFANNSSLKIHIDESIQTIKNSAGVTLNLNELCSTIDGQHVLIVHKHQASRNEKKI